MERENKERKELSPQEKRIIEVLNVSAMAEQAYHFATEEGLAENTEKAQDIFLYFQAGEKVAYVRIPISRIIETMDNVAVEEGEEYVVTEVRFEETTWHMPTHILEMYVKAEERFYKTYNKDEQAMYLAPADLEVRYESKKD